MVKTNYYFIIFIRFNGSLKVTHIPQIQVKVVCEWVRRGGSGLESHIARSKKAQTSQQNKRRVTEVD